MKDYNTILDQPLSGNLVKNYFNNLVNRYFKILPMRENNEPSLSKYLRSLRIELIGCKGIIPELREEPDFLTLLSILEYIIENPNCPIDDIRSEVFHAISICKRLQKRANEEE